MLLSEEGSPQRAAATSAYEESLRGLLEIARDQECGMFLEVAGELSR